MEGGRAGSKNGGSEIGGTFNGNGAIGRREKTLRLDLPQSLRPNVYMNERFYFFTLSLEQVREREREGGE